MLEKIHLTVFRPFFFNPKHFFLNIPTCVRAHHVHFSYRHKTPYFRFGRDFSCTRKNGLLFLHEVRARVNHMRARVFFFFFFTFALVQRKKQFWQQSLPKKYFLTENGVHNYKSRGFSLLAYAELNFLQKTHFFFSII